MLSKLAIALLSVIGVIVLGGIITAIVFGTRKEGTPSVPTPKPFDPVIPTYTPHNSISEPNFKLLDTLNMEKFGTNVYFTSLDGKRNINGGVCVTSVVNGSVDCIFFKVGHDNKFQITRAVLKIATTRPITGFVQRTERRGVVVLRSSTHIHTFAISEDPNKGLVDYLAPFKNVNDVLPLGIVDSDPNAPMYLISSKAQGSGSEFKGSLVAQEIVDGDKLEGTEETTPIKSTKFAFVDSASITAKGDILFTSTNHNSISGVIFHVQFDPVKGKFGDTLQIGKTFPVEAQNGWVEVNRDNTHMLVCTSGSSGRVVTTYKPSQNIADWVPGDPFVITSKPGPSQIAILDDFAMFSNNSGSNGALNNLITRIDHSNFTLIEEGANPLKGDPAIMPHTNGFISMVYRDADRKMVYYLATTFPDVGVKNNQLQLYGMVPE